MTELGKITTKCMTLSVNSLKMILRIIFLLGICNGIAYQVFAQKEFHYPETIFDNQKFGISNRQQYLTIDAKGHIITAIRRGIQIYDGQRWQNIFIGKDSSKINPLYTPRLYKVKSYKDMLFVVGKHTIGVLQPNERGKFFYHEIANQALTKEQLGFVAQVVVKGQKAFFLGWEGILVFDIVSKKKQIKKNGFKAKYVSFYEIGEDIVAKFYKQRTYRLNFNKLKWEETRQYPFINAQTFPQEVLKLKDGRFLFVDKINKTFISNKHDKLSSFDLTLDTLFDNQYFFSFKQFKETLYVITKQDFIIYDLIQKRILYRRRFSAMLSSLAITKQGDVWLSTLTSGVFFIEINSIFKTKPNEGNIISKHIFANTTIIRYKDYSFLVKTKKWSQKYKLSTTGPIRHIRSFNGEILFIAYKGVFTLQKKQLIKISSSNTYLLHQSTSIPSLFYQFTDKHFKILQKERHKLIVLDSVKFDAIVHSVVEKNKSIWVGADMPGIKRIKLSSDGKTIKGVKHYLREKKRGQDSFSAFIFRDKPCFNNSSGIFFYDKAADSIKRYTIKYDSTFSKKYTKDFVQHYTFLNVINNDSILVTPGATSKFNTPGLLVYRDKYFEWQNAPFKRMENYRYRNLEKSSNKTYLLHTAHPIYELSPSKEVNTAYKFKTYIRDVSVQIPFVDSDNRRKLSDSTVYTSHTAIKSPTKLNYQYNTLIFTYASDSWAAYERNEYSYQLIGQDETWSNWTNEQKKEYTHLREGTYTFQVRCKNVYGTISSVANYTFTISPPWYRTWWAYTFYALSAIGLLLGGSVAYSRYRTRQIRLRNQELEQVVEERTEEIRAKNEEITQQSEELKVTNDQLKEANILIKKDRDEKVKIYLQEATEAASKLKQIQETLTQRGPEIAQKLLTNEINTAGELSIIQEKVRGEFPGFASEIDKALADKKITKIIWQVGYCLKLGRSPVEIAKILPLSNRTVSVYGTKLRNMDILEAVKK